MQTLIKLSSGYFINVCILNLNSLMTLVLRVLSRSEIKSKKQKLVVIISKYFGGRSTMGNTKLDSR